jgi:hypothetical protein
MLSVREWRDGVGSSSGGAGGGFFEGKTIDRGDRTWKVMMKNTAVVSFSDL